jgi:hypothetical protein
MRIFVLIAFAGISVSSPALAAGFFEDISHGVGKAIEKAAHDTGNTVEKATHDTGHTIEKAAHDTGNTVEKATYDAGNAIEKATHDTGNTIQGRPLDADPLAPEKVKSSPGQDFEKAMRDTGLVVENSPYPWIGIVRHRAQSADQQPLNNAAIAAKAALASKTFIDSLVKKPDDELLNLSLTEDLCNIIECFGLTRDIARQAVTLVRTRKETTVDLEIRRTQATSAEFSAAAALLSLVISIASFVRAGRRDAKEPTPAVTPTAPTSVAGAPAAAAG